MAGTQLTTKETSSYFVQNIELEQYSDLVKSKITVKNIKNWGNLKSKFGKFVTVALREEENLGNGKLTGRECSLALDADELQQLIEVLQHALKLTAE